MVSIGTLKEFQKHYNEWKTRVSPLGKYAVTTRFNDKTSGGLTDMIVAFFEMYGLMCWRVDVQGTLREKDGRSFYATTKNSKGVSDLFTIVKGHFLAIEVKIGADIQSPKQIEFEIDICNQGGSYMIAKTWNDFFTKFTNWYNTNFNEQE